MTLVIRPVGMRRWTWIVRGAWALVLVHIVLAGRRGFRSGRGTPSVAADL